MRSLSALGDDSSGPSRNSTWSRSERIYNISLLLFLLLMLVSGVRTISIDNDIIGEPDIECLDDEIRVWVKTRKYFAGRIYAKGRADVPDCYKDDFQSERTKKPHFDLKFGVCGMRSLRSIDPRGMYYGITIVVSFHPLFITKVDQAFHVKCFFEEASRGLTAELGVSAIPTTEVEARHGIPGCTYSIHRSSIDDIDTGRPAGEPIQFARVGDKVLHQWHCDDQMFGVLINNCYVTDGFGKKAEVIDDKGCPVDPLLITGIRYSSDLQRAYAESQVFKFADKPGVWFFCQVQMCMKKAGMCRGITPPSACASTAPPGIEPPEIEDAGFTEAADEDYASGPKNRKKGKQNKNIDEDYETKSKTKNVDEDYETRTTPKRGKKRRTTTLQPPTDYADYEGSNELHKSADPGQTYGRTPTASIDYELTTEPVTAFAPPLPADFGPAHEKIFGQRSTTVLGTETVTADFETDNDLDGGTTSPTKDGKKENEYDDEEVTIPPNLTDLLANLPDEDVSADKLQRMFRDSVDNRKAILEGFEMLKKKMKKPSSSSLNKKTQVKQRRELPGTKIQSMQVSWNNRMRDAPLEDENETVEDEEMIKQRMLLEASKIEAGLKPKEGDQPMIAGQLLIYEIDEEPPITQAAKRGGVSTMATCAISRDNLVALVGGLGGAAGFLFFLTLALYLRLTRVQSGKLERKEPFAAASEELRRKVSSAFSTPMENFIKSRRAEFR